MPHSRPQYTPPWRASEISSDSRSQQIIPIAPGQH